MGGTLGAIGGFGVGGPVGAIAGGAAGSAGGQALAPSVAEFFGYTPSEPVTGSRAGDVALAGGTGALSEIGGQYVIAPAVRAAAPVVRRMLPGLKAGARETAAAAEALGVPLKPSDIAGGRGTAFVERAVAQAPGGASRMGAVAERQAQAVTRAAEELGERIGPAAAPREVGAQAVDAIERQLSRAKRAEKQLWEQNLLARWGDTPVSTGELKQTVKNMAAREAERPLARHRNQAILDAADNLKELPEQSPLRQLRDIEQGFLAEARPGRPRDLIRDLPQAQADRLAAVSRQSLEAGAEEAGGTEARAALGQAKQQSREMRQLYRRRELTRLRAADPEDVADQLLRGGVSDLERLKGAILGSAELGQETTPAEEMPWNALRRKAFDGLIGKATRPVPGVEAPRLSGALLEKELGKLGPEKLQALLTPTEQQALAQLQRVAQAVQAGERVGAQPGTSSTAGALGWQALTRAPAAGAGALVAGPLGAIAGATVGEPVAAAMSAVAARVLTSPRLVKLALSPQVQAAAQALDRGTLTHGQRALLGRVTTLAGVREGAAPEGGAEASAPAPAGTVRIETPIPGLQPAARERPKGGPSVLPGDRTQRLLLAERDGELSAQAAADLAELRRRRQFPPAIPR